MATIEHNIFIITELAQVCDEVDRRRIEDALEALVDGLTDIEGFFDPNFPDRHMTFEEIEIAANWWKQDITP